MGAKDKFREFYTREETVESYDRIRLRYFHRRIHRFLERFTATLYLRKNSSILEVGCGTGFITQDLVKYGRVTCIDPSGNMIRLAKERIGNKAKFERKSIFDLNYNGKFDYAVSYRVLNHFDEEDLVKALKKIKSAVKKNGLVIFTLENKSFLRNIIRYLRSGGKSEAPIYQHSVRQIGEIGEKADLKIKDILAIQHTWLLLPFHLLGEIIGSEKYENFVFSLESMLFHLRLWNNDWVVICEKSSL